MALIGDTNFSLQPNVNMAAIASLYQKQKTDEQTMAAQQSQMQSQEQDRIMNVMKMASDMTQNMIQGSAAAQMREGRKNLQDLLGSQNEPAPSSIMQPAGSRLFPGMTQAPTTIPKSQTPEFQQAYQQAAFQANPDEATKNIAERAFAPKQPTYQNENVMIDGVPTTVNFNPVTGQRTTLDGKPITGKVEPYSPMSPNIALDDKFRQDMTPTALAIIAGRQDIMTATSMRGANREKMSQLLNELAPTYNAQHGLDPTQGFDASTNKQRIQIRKAFAEGGEASNALQAYSTALVHSDRLQKKMEALDNSMFPAWNKVANKASAAVGHPELAAFQTVRNTFAVEMSKAAASGVITEDERQRQLENFDSSTSKVQLNAAVEEAIGLMSEKAAVKKEGWTNTMGDAKPGTPFITKNAAEVLKKHNYDPETLHQVSQGGGLNIDQDALAAELKRRGL